MKVKFSLVFLLITMILWMAQPVKAATSVTVGYSGIGPTVLGLTWTTTQDACFRSYDIQYSTSGSNGPWTSLTNQTSYSVTTQYAYGLTPSTNWWWRVIDIDCLGSALSNTLQVTQSSVATLSTVLTSTSARFTWNNHAAYAGQVAFLAYQLMESINGGSYSLAATIADVATLSYTVNGLTPGTGYSFYLITTDQCNGCTGSNYASGSNSNVVTFQTPPLLTASASAHPSSVDVGQLVSFTCAASGGAGPYTYSWVFGDSNTEQTQSPTHTYASAGTMSATCTVQDSYGTTANSVAVVTVSTDPVLTVPAAQPSTADVGQTVTFTTQASGGSGSYTYAWTGLPAGCLTANSDTISCTLTTAGTFNVVASVTDSNGFTTTSSPSIFTVSPTVLGLPQTEGFVVIGGSVAAGAAVVAAILIRRKK